ncbi:MAG TPA: hypothetical protein PJ991_09470 [Kiritimatiellia bacterium]|nr:hypothetical protein [Kiritimatiellia bacterium]
MANSDDQNHIPEPDAQTHSEEVNLQDLVTDLNFVPNWARSGGDGAKGYSDHPGDMKTSGRDRRPPRRDARGPNRDPGRSNAPKFRNDQRGNSGANGQARTKEDFQGGRDGRRKPRMHQERIQLPLEVSFIPERDRMGAIVRQLHAIKRAFPLTYIAGLFLTKPEYHLIKLEARTGNQGEPLQLWQCRETKLVFLNKEGLLEHLVRTMLEKHFERVETIIDPPAGNFVCVGQCKRSGMLMGPPNYHGYNEKLLEAYRIHAAPGMSLDQYRNNIEMVRDPALIEKWKDECRTQVRYRPVQSEPDTEAVMTLTQVESVFLEKYASAYVVAGSKVIMPAVRVNELNDQKLKDFLQQAWLRENRFPFTLMLALRPAFKRMRLYLFKAGKDATYVTAIPPKPLDAEHAIQNIKAMVDLISEHPGWSKKQLVEKLYPGKTMDDPEVVEQMNPLGWLVDKGHIIEFFNGTYAVPGHLQKPGATPSESPQAHHHPEPTQEPEISVNVTAVPSTAPDGEIAQEADPAQPA